MTETDQLHEGDGSRRWAEAASAIDLLGSALVVAAVLIPFAQFLGAWALQHDAAITTDSPIGGILRTGIVRVGLGPSLLVLAATLLVGLTGARPLSVAKRRLLVAIIGIGIALAVALGVGALDALVSRPPSGSTTNPSDGPLGYRVGVALGMAAAGAIAGVSAWVAFTTYEQDRIGSADLEEPSATP